ncbi:ATP-binding protein [Dyadobacter sp. NIV53]|uniref:ATP-binding protein n=1 Tax=Dyadobacter sp. NIV53 TaxID=2861765 RepID=UPI001C882925|nr:ATP-binding protein [Dyadobacter sp. NIV53]
MNNLDFLIICIDENNLVVKSYGDTTKYLFQRNFTLNLTDLLEDRLAVAFKTLRNKVIKTNKKASVSGIEIEKGKAAIQVNLSVSPLANSGKDQKMLLVVFSENKQGSPVSKENIMFDNKMYLDQYTQSLEEELQELKDTLRDSNEKLYATSENMQSFSEELLSANEEMQSTNEEMESVNEELHTINSEYLFKNKELLELNDDLNNYFKSNINGQLFVNQQLELMKFSPGTLKLINLQDSDLGRPINKILTNFKFQAITEDINKVIKDGSVITKEIETNDNKWYQVMTMPYIKQAGNIRNGAIVTFADITELKDTQKQLDEKNKSLMRINADLDNFVHTASHDLLSPLGSIEGSISAMNEIGVNDPELKVFLDIIDSSIKKFRSLIIDIATIAKLESNTIIMEMVDLNETINNIEWSLNDKIASSKAVIHRDLEIKEIYFSKKNLRSIVFNLISNAIKFKSDKPPVIYIKTKKVNNNTILTVEDNGIGIAEKDSEQIFKKYGRLKMDIDGQGIGLYLAKKIVDSAGGDIIVESTPGKGSKFILCFPTVQDAS